MNETSSEETLKMTHWLRYVKKTNHIIIAHLNINSIRNKFDMLKEIIGNTIDILLMSETKLDNTFSFSSL